MPRGRRVRQQQLQPAGIDRTGIHHDSDRKNCSRCTAGCCAPVTGSALASAVQRLVPVPRRQQPGQVLPETLPLRHISKQVIEPGRVILQRANSGRARHRLRHQSSPAPKTHTLQMRMLSRPVVTPATTTSPGAQTGFIRRRRECITGLRPNPTRHACAGGGRRKSSGWAQGSHNVTVHSPLAAVGWPLPAEPAAGARDDATAYCR